LSHDAWSDRLSEYLDGLMSADDHAACEAHLATCVECSRTLESLREVVAQARALPDLPPADDLWPEIHQRIGYGSVVPDTRRRFAFRLPRHVHLTLPQAMAAGFVLVALSGGLMWWVLRQGSPAPPGGSRGESGGLTAARPEAGTSGGAPGPAAARAPERGTPRTAAAGASGSAPDVARYAAYEAHYDQAIAELERTLEEHRSELDTSTVRVVTQDLVIIDHAIEQARRALDKDPASPYLHQHLALEMKLKLDLLRRTAAFAGPQG
jgi:hypothetical protein